MAAVPLAAAFVRIRPEGSGFKGETEGIINQVDGSPAGRKVGHGFLTGMKTILASTAAAGVGVSLFAGKFAKEAVDGYRDHNRVADITAQVIKSTGGAAKIGAADVGSLADAIERKTGVDGDAIQSGANLLLTFTNVKNEAGKGNQVFSQATSLLADMSVALGQDTKGSAIQLGKALNDPIKGVTALSKVGVSFTEGQKKQIKTLVDGGNVMAAQKVILRELSKEFGGAAAAQVTNSDRQTVAYHQLQDAVGAQLLPVMDQFQGFMASKILPTLTELATSRGPAVVAFLRRMALGVQGLYSLLVQGDFTSAFRQAFNLEEDSGTVDKLFRIRDGVIGVFDLVVKGDFSSHFREAFNLEEDSSTVDTLFNIRDAITGFFDTLRAGDTGTLKADFASIGSSLLTLSPVIAQAAQSMPSFTDALHVGSDVLGFFADHAHLLAQAMPVLIAAFTAYKVLQLANNTLGRNSVIGFGLQTAATFALAASNRQLAASNGAVAATQNVATASTSRGTIATIAQTVASRVAAGASKVWAAGQWLLNAALTANPIGIVIVAVAALVAGIIIAWRHSQTFRTVVLSVWSAVKSGVMSAINWLRSAVPAAFAFIKSSFLRYTPLGVVLSHWSQIRAGIGSAVNGIKGIIAWFGGLPGMFSRWFGSARDGAVRMLGDLLSWVGGLPGRIVSALGNIGGLLLGAGADLVRGFISGISGMVGEVVRAVSGVVGSAIDAAKSLLHIKSPSRVFMEIGHQTGAGMVVGLNGQAGAVRAATQNMIHIPPLRTPALAGVGGGRMSSGASGGSGNGSTGPQTFYLYDADNRLITTMHGVAAGEVKAAATAAKWSR